ncbi:carbon-nitrogen hydrolase family protein [Helicobacter fennelliae]|uniref:Omega amidase n=1 Tax=Helicobacter fennelliae MRY12-0050 TaxID=1325130 RepID=T1DX41_9HELI|nr:carbon-nitrogen hydrolase family protein [Helicobacter fennelliae]GAD19912.1 omega amidase [Helicobacter fennelliae MRY12-0050]STP08088.1 putative nitrilase/cyanide hydratase [Helicobacter fennelliae]
MTFKEISALQITTKQNFQTNLKKLKEAISKNKKDSITLTPELMLSGFSYQKMEEASEFSKIATQELLQMSADRTIITTMIEKKNHRFYNNLKVFSKGELIHKQSKHHLFTLGDEHLHFEAGSVDEIIPFYIDSIKCAALICFELRFVELWQEVRGVDIVFVPVQWGKQRKHHLETLSRALAIINQCFVVVSASSNLQMAKSSSIITPYGNVYSNEDSENITHKIDLKEVAKMRKYIDTGINECSK